MYSREPPLRGILSKSESSRQGRSTSPRKVRFDASLGDVTYSKSRSPSSEESLGTLPLEVILARRQSSESRSEIESESDESSSETTPYSRYRSCGTEASGLIQVPDGGLTIKQSGDYSLSADVKYTGNRDAITISADSVTLDLRHHTITGKGLRRNGVVAIRVKTGCHNIRIIHGTIENFAPFGLVLEPNTESVELESLYFRANGTPKKIEKPDEAGAFLIEDARLVKLRQITSCDNFAGGGVIRDVDGLEIISSKFNNQLGKGHSVGLYLGGRRHTGVRFWGCTFNGNQGGTWVSGLQLAADNEGAYSSVEIVDCEANGNLARSGSARSCQGFNLRGMDALWMKDSHAFHNTIMESKAGHKPSQANGLVINQSQNVFIEGCAISNIKGGNLSTSGVRIVACRRLNIDRCQVTDVQGHKKVPAYGWYLDRVSDAVVQQSVAEKIKGSPSSSNWYFRSSSTTRVINNTALTGSRGYFVDGHSRGVSFENNYADAHEKAAFSAKKRNRVDTYIKNTAIRCHPNYALDTLPKGIPVQTWVLGEPMESHPESAWTNLDCVSKRKESAKTG